MPLYSPPAAGGSGVTDHGDLTGLADDDHTAYATDTNLSDHAADTTAIHGIADTSVLLTTTHTAAADPHTGYLLESLLDAKGDLVVASAADTPARLAAGTNGHVLTADSAETTGIKWAAAAGGSATKGFHNFRQIGTTRDRWYASGGLLTGAPGTVTTAIGTLIAVPYYERRGGTLDRIAFRVTTLAAGGVARTGIYSNTSDTDLYPNALVVDGGEVLTTTTGAKAATISQVLTADTLYWFVYLCGVQAPTVQAIDSDSAAEALLGLVPALNAAAPVGLSVAQAYGALPATYPAGATYVVSPQILIAVRYSA